MKHLLILATLVLGLALAVTPLHAYDFSDTERQVQADGDRQWRQNDQRQLEQAQANARNQSQENDRLSHQNRQFDPSDYRPQSPFTFSDNSGRVQVCRRNNSGAVFCQ